jgi:hypothetical protein
VLYVVSANSTDSFLLRNLRPTDASPSDTHWSVKDSEGEQFVITPSNVRVAVSDTTPTLYAIDTANGDALYNFKDTINAAGPTLTSPDDGTTVTMNPVTGKAYDVTFTWERPSSYVTDYDLQIAVDSDFDEIAREVTSYDPSGDPTAVSYILGPSTSTTADNTLEFMPGGTYYWRVRVAQDGPIYSAWSESRSFSIAALEVAVPQLLAPANGKADVSLTPAFSWNPVVGATKYEFQLAVAPHAKSWSSPVATSTVAETAIRPLVKLDNDTTYFWRVRVAAPTVGEWSGIANFSTVAIPEVAPPPVVVQEMPAPQLVLPPQPAPPPDIIIPPAPAPPAPITPAYIWAIIIIGAVLVIAVIILIVRTWRPV